MNHSDVGVYVKVINEKCHRDLTFGKVYEAGTDYVQEGWWRIKKDDVGDEHDVDVYDVELVKEEAQTLNEVLKAKLDKYAEWEKCKEKCPRLWNYYKDILNDEALDKLVDVILSQDVKIDDCPSLEYAFKWVETNDPAFWGKVFYGGCSSEDVAQSPSEPLNTILHTKTQDIVENAVESDTEPAAGGFVPNSIDVPVITNNEFTVTKDFMFEFGEKAKPITSDGSSSDYYKLEIVRTSDGAVFECEMGDVLYSIVGGDFCLSNILKASRRAYLASIGSGKEGVSVDYDMNKIKWFANDFKQRSK